MLPEKLPPCFVILFPVAPVKPLYATAIQAFQSVPDQSGFQLCEPLSGNTEATYIRHSIPTGGEIQVIFITRFFTHHKHSSRIPTISCQLIRPHCSFYVFVRSFSRHQHIDITAKCVRIPVRCKSFIDLIRQLFVTGTLKFVRQIFACDCPFHHHAYVFQIRASFTASKLQHCK